MKRNLLLFIPSILCFSIAFAQTPPSTGPGGVGNSSNNINWHIADSIGLPNGSPVGLWADLSGNGNDLQQSGTARPTYETNAINGRSALNFDGLDDFLTFDNRISTSDFSYAIVFNREKISSIRQLFITDKHVFTANVNSNNNGTGLRYSGQYISAGAVSDNIYTITSGQVSGSSTTLNLGNNSNYFIKTRPALNNLSLNSTISKPNNEVKGHVAEIIYFNKVLNTAERSIIDNYLAAKYNRSITNDRYAYDNNFGHGVIGIGQESDGNNTAAQGKGRLFINNASSLNDGDYLLVGHNNLGFGTGTSTPSGVVERWNQVWRADKTGTPGSISALFFLGNDDFAPNVNNYVVLVDTVDGDFSNGGTYVHETGRSYSSANNSIAFTDLNLKDGAYFTLAEKTGTITSIADGPWGVITTWDCLCIPGKDDIVITQNSVSINNNQSVLNLSIDGSGSLTFNGSDTLFIYGSLNHAGSFNPGTGTIAAEKNVDIQSFNNASNAVFSFYNLYVSNELGLKLNSGGWEVQHNLQVDSGGMDVSNADSIVLLSNASSTSQILPSMNNAFSGNFIVQRYIGQRNSDWSNLSSPVENATIADWDDDLYMSGVGGNDGNVTYGSGAIYYTVFSYNHQQDKHDTISSTSTQLVPGSGYELWLADNAQQYNGGTVDVEGTPNNGTVTTVMSQGWNLLGNPYHSFFNYDSLRRVAFIPDYYYIWNTDNGSYDFFNGSGKPPIAPEQGFWTRIIPGGALFVYFNENGKVDNNSSVFLRKKQDNPFALKVSSKEVPFQHKMEVDFSPFSSQEIDEKDAYYLKSRIEEAPAITTFASNSEEALIYNSLNPTEESQLVPVSIYAGVAGDYSIQADNLDALYNNYSCVYLKDNETEEAVDLMVEPNYAFEAKQGKSDRFHLILSNSYDQCQEMIKNGEFNQKLDTKVSLRNAYEQWYLDYTLGEEQTQLEVRIYNMSGQEVKASQSFEANGAGTYPLQNLKDLDGIYLIQVIGKDVFLNKQVKL